ncbi:MAG: MoaD/ThiS family protein [Thermodesulfobacteriota bacterium]|nr:MoaD/ThiS family protein [Thermodesulfobacteriota bacterium]
MITVKVFPTLRSFLHPEIPRSAEFPLDLTALGKKTVSIEDLINHLGIPTGKVDMAIINGKILRDLNQTVKDGDVVVLSPSIAGG